MGMIKHMLAGAALVVVAASPVLASEPVRPGMSTVAGKSIALRKNARAGAPTTAGNGIAGAALALLIVAGAAGAAGIVAAADGDNSSN